MKERALLNYEIIKKINMIGYESTIEREKLASIEPLSSFYFCTNDGEEEAFFNKIIEVSQNVLEINDIPNSLKRLRQLIEVEQLPFEDNQDESSKKTCSSTIVLFDENYHDVNFIMINLPRIFYSTQSIYYSNG